MGTLELLSLEQAADLAGVHQRTLHKLIKEGRGPKHVMIGRQVRIRSDAWEQWLDVLSADHEETAA